MCIVQSDEIKVKPFSGYYIDNGVRKKEEKNVLEEKNYETCNFYTFFRGFREKSRCTMDIFGNLHM